MAMFALKVIGTALLCSSVVNAIAPVGQANEPSFMAKMLAKMATCQQTGYCVFDPVEDRTTMLQVNNNEKVLKAAEDANPGLAPAAKSEPETEDSKSEPESGETGSGETGAEEPGEDETEETREPDTAAGDSKSEPEPGEPESGETGAEDGWFQNCKRRSPFCDMRLNIKYQIGWEEKWIVDQLVHFKSSTAANLKTFGDQLYKHIDARNKETGHDEALVKRKEAALKKNPDKEYKGSTACMQFKTLDDYKKFLTKNGIHEYKEAGDALNTARIYTNWLSSGNVGFKDASDNITDSGKPDGTPEFCSFEQKDQEGWSTDMNDLKDKIRGEGKYQESSPKYMWQQEKGRGKIADKVAMTYNIPRIVVEDALGKKLGKDWTTKYGFFHSLQVKILGIEGEIEGENEAIRDLTKMQKRILPGPVRWYLSFSTKRLGIFTYGDKPDTPATDQISEETQNNFFYAAGKTAHGMGVHGRNMLGDNPASRMREVGMPYIGGVSGSVVDFYVALKLTERKGKVLTDLMVQQIALLGAGGQHSVSELMFGSFEAFKEDADDDDDYAELTHPFKGPIFRELMGAMNDMDEESWRTTKDSMVAKFHGGMLEFFERTKYGRAAVDPPQPPKALFTKSLAKFADAVGAGKDECLKPEYRTGMKYFRQAIEVLGGPEEATREETDDISQEKFLALVMRGRVEIEDVRTEMKNMLEKKETLTPDQTKWKQMDQATALTTLYSCFEKAAEEGKLSKALAWFYYKSWVTHPEDNHVNMEAAPKDTEASEEDTEASEKDKQELVEAKTEASGQAQAAEAAAEK